MVKFLKWAGIVISALVIIIVIVALIISSSTTRRMNKTYSVEPAMITIPSDSAAIANGQQLAAMLCMDCHGNDMGGTAFFNDKSLGRIDAPNLTPGKGGIGGKYSDKDWIRSIRHGVRTDGKPLVVMPSKDYNIMGEQDLGNLIAYLKTLPPADKEWLRDPQFTFMGKILVAIGAFGQIIPAEVIDHAAAFPVAPQMAATPEYGKYLTDVFGCRTCHGADLNGGKDPNPAAPFAPNLTKAGNLGKWSEEEFINTMRTGVRPDKSQLSEFMPWQGLASMKAEQIKAVHAYLMSLPAMETDK